MTICGAPGDIIMSQTNVGETGGHWDIFHILLNIWTLRNIYACVTYHNLLTIHSAT